MGQMSIRPLRSPREDFVNKIMQLKLVWMNKVDPPWISHLGSVSDILPDSQLIPLIISMTSPLAVTLLGRAQTMRSFCIPCALAMPLSDFSGNLHFWYGDLQSFILNIPIAIECML